MGAFKRMGVVGVFAVLALFTIGCAPEIGSEKWCANMKEKAKGEWTANEAADFAKHCLL
jgi:hypothetical protein